MSKRALKEMNTEPAAWWDFTFNPWWGCAKVSPGCKFCYALDQADRTGFDEIWGVGSDRRTFPDKHWNGPARWAKLAEANGTRYKVFCASMADIFEDRDDLNGERAKLFAMMEATSEWLDWLFVTKRPENILKMVPEAWLTNWPANVWAGTSVENQKWADIRIPELLKVPATVRFLSMEPLIGPVDMSPWVEALEWVVVGGESGPNSRPMETEWATDIAAACGNAGTPFWMKQKGVVWATLNDAEGKGVDWDKFPEDCRVRQYPSE